MMRIVAFLQQHLGFTRSEIRAIIVLGTVFLIGLGVRWYRDMSGGAAAEFDYRQADSIFAARSRSYEALSLASAKAAGSAQPSIHKNAGHSLTHLKLNTASGPELERLPGVGAATARQILIYRQEHGRFSSVNELLNIRGIGPKKLERMRPFLVLD